MEGHEFRAALNRRSWSRARALGIYLQNFMPVDFPATLGLGEEPAQEFESTPLVFAPGQPDCFWESEGGIPYRGQEGAKKRLDLYINTLAPGERIKTLLVGPAGLGKTTLARIVAYRIRKRQREMGVSEGKYFEVMPSQIEEKEDLDAFMHTLARHPGSVVYLDEVHDLINMEDMYHVLHDTGSSKYPLAGGGWLDIPGNIHWLGATTDPGSLPDALRRRFEPEIRLDTPSVEDIAHIILDQAEHDNVLIKEEVATMIAERAGRLPWQAHILYTEAKKHAQLNESGLIAPDHAEGAFETLGVDALGLRKEDLDVIRALLRVNGGKGIPVVSSPGVVRYRMGEEALCAAAGIDRLTYKKRVQPKLIHLGLLIVLQGQCLTDDAVERYKGKL